MRRRPVRWRSWAVWLSRPPLCLVKGLGIRRMGEIFALLALGGLGKSALGYRGVSQLARLTWFFSWDRTYLAASGGGPSGADSGRMALRAAATEGGWRFPQTCSLALTLASWLLVVLVVLGRLYRAIPVSRNRYRACQQLLHGNPPPNSGSSRITAIWQEAPDMGRSCRYWVVGRIPISSGSRLVFTREPPGGQVRRTSVDAAHCEYLNSG
ncbi:MAG: hypothetical protein ACLU9S_20710 [Oscillospiraceae bacterium]